MCVGYSISILIIAFIEDDQLVIKTLKHIDLQDVKRNPTPQANGLPTKAFIIYFISSLPGADAYLIETDYLVETYR